MASREGESDGYGDDEGQALRRLLGAAMTSANTLALQMMLDRLKSIEERLAALETPPQSAVEAPGSDDPDDFETWPLDKQRAAYRADYEGGRSGTVFMDDLGHMFATLDCGGDVNFTVYSLDNSESAFASLDPHEVIRLHDVLAKRIAEYGPASAWDEGFAAGVNTDMGDYEHPPEVHDNPYRTGADQ